MAPGDLSGTKRPVSERSIFLLQELLKLRRLDREQCARLLRLGDATRAKTPIYRLYEKGLVTTDYLPVGRKSVPIVKLSEQGYKWAAHSVGHEIRNHYKDYPKVDALAHLLMGNELYLRIVAEGAADWLEVRRNSSCFSWRPSNDNTLFRWLAPSQYKHKPNHREVIPDVTIESESTRYFIEIERSTKTLNRAASKFEPYCDLFSPVKSAVGGSGYAQKYTDEKVPVVVFVFENEERAASARVRFEKRAKDPLLGCYIPHWRCGTGESIGAMLRSELLGTPGSLPAPFAEDSFVRRYGQDLLNYILETSATIAEVRQLVAAGKPVPRPEGLPSVRKVLADILPILRQAHPNVAPKTARSQS